jgi:hypothetical protein
MRRETDYQWYRAVQDALAENDPIQIEARLQLAEFAIFDRIDTFSRADHGEEEQALFDALKIVRGLKLRHFTQEHRKDL